MPIAKTDIFNIALVYLGVGQVQTAQDDTEAADVLNALYPVSKLNCLEKGEWSFARRVANLGAPLAVDPAELENFTNMHSLPQDHVKSWRFVGDDPEIALNFQEVADKRILSDYASPDLVYVADVAEGSFSGNFCSMLAAHLAWEATYALTSFSGRRMQLSELYMKNENDALLDNAQRRTTQRITNINLSRVR